MIYTGIGARKTPDNIIKAMVGVGIYMADHGHTLRSGGAHGADAAFERGCDRARGLKEIYLPYQGFKHNKSPLHHVGLDAQDVAALFHPAWERCDPYTRHMMGRNSYQILGADLKTKTNVVFCWTPGGKVVGGTGQALRMAIHYGIPVFNLGSAPLNDMNERILDFLERES